jgi:hypothetical protein
MYTSLLGSVNYSDLCIRYGVRTRASAVKGQRVNHFTNRTFKREASGLSGLLVECNE